jgi:hypothetical protein
MLPLNVLIAIRAQRGPPLDFWYQTPTFTDFPHATVVGLIALIRTSALAAVVPTASASEAAASPLAHALPHQPITDLKNRPDE